MTLVAKIVVDTLLIWTHISTTSYVNNGPPGNCMYVPTLRNERGAMYVRELAVFDWKGAEIRAELSRSRIDTVLERSIDIGSSGFGF